MDVPFRFTPTYASWLNQVKPWLEKIRRATPCPATGLKTGAVPGYVIDRIQALKRGGLDEPGNMQWQTIAEARASLVSGFLY